jgi:hypothetical protein
MHAESMDGWTHDHVFLGADHARNERPTRIVTVRCCTIMVAEIVGESAMEQALSAFRQG